MSPTFVAVACFLTGVVLTLLLVQIIDQAVQRKQ